jgi:hypothetical protein
MHPNPYAADLGDADALTALAETPERIRALVQGWSADRWERSYAPGKWTARQILTHLAQTELALTTRARFAASQPNYTAQPFSQDDWIPLDAHADGRTALEAYTGLRRFNLAMFRNLPADRRRQTFTHPEYGELTPEWIASQLAGHDIHHLKQLQRIG